MLNSLSKPRVLIFIPNYLPGYKAGGILRTIVNTVHWLNSDYEFWIVTRDRDLGDDEPFQNISVNEWRPIEGAMVYYLSPEHLSTKNLIKLIAETPHDLIYLNSLFDSVFTIRILLARRMGLLPSNTLILAPRGELVEGSLRLKRTKKIVYITLSKLLGVYKGLIWHASTKHELQDFINVMGVNPNDIRVALDLPSQVIVDLPCSPLLVNDHLRVVFLSRLTREKNLDCALRILKQVNVKLIFDIYGPDEDSRYWNKCQSLIEQLPRNIIATYHGAVPSSSVPDIFSGYDLFFFPTSGENYGHVIAEAVTVGTRVLISKNTPWLNLENDGLGWDVDLTNETEFVRIIEKLADEGLEERLKKRALVKKSALKRLMNPKVLNDNRELFRMVP